MLISQEDLLGAPADLLCSPVYPRAAAAASFLAGLTRGGARLRLFLAVRGFDDMLAAGYAQALRLRSRPEGFAAAKARMLAAPRPWSNLARRLLRACPGAELRIWRDESRPEDAERMAAFVAGADPGLAFVAPPEPPPPPSADAVAAAEAVDLPCGPERAARIDEIYRAHPACCARKRFNPLDEGERARLRERLDRDLAALEAWRPGTLVRRS